MISPGANEDPTKGHGFCMCGAGENVLASAADFENFLEPRPDLPTHMDEELEKYVLLALLSPNSLVVDLPMSCCC